MEVLLVNTTAVGQDDFGYLLTMTNKELHLFLSTSNGDHFKNRLNELELEAYIRDITKVLVERVTVKKKITNFIPENSDVIQNILREIRELTDNQELQPSHRRNFPTI